MNMNFLMKKVFLSFVLTIGTLFSSHVALANEPSLSENSILFDSYDTNLFSVYSFRTENTEDGYFRNFVDSIFVKRMENGTDLGHIEKDSGYQGLKKSRSLTLLKGEEAVSELLKYLALAEKNQTVDKINYLKFQKSEMMPADAPEFAMTWNFWDFASEKTPFVYPSDSFGKPYYVYRAHFTLFIRKDKTRVYIVKDTYPTILISPTTEPSNEESVAETVKCIFENNTAKTHTCYLAGRNDVQCSGEGSCTVKVSGNKTGEKLVWKSTCGGYSSTVLDGAGDYDGQGDYAKFSCGSGNTISAPTQPSSVITAESVSSNSIHQPENYYPTYRTPEPRKTYTQIRASKGLVVMTKKQHDQIVAVFEAIPSDKKREKLEAIRSSLQKKYEAVTASLKRKYNARLAKTAQLLVDLEDLIEEELERTESDSEDESVLNEILR